MSGRGRQRSGMVRSYVPTGGEATVRRRTLDLATLLRTDRGKSLDGLSDHACRIVEHLRPGFLSIADVSADLDMPVASVKVLADRLIDSGHLTSRQPVPAAELVDPKLLQEVLDGLAKL